MNVSLVHEIHPGLNKDGVDERALEDVAQVWELLYCTKIIFSRKQNVM